MNERLKLNGFCRITEVETGKIVLEAHNMIVKTGREFILNKVFGIAESRTIDSIYFSNGKEMTEENMTAVTGNPKVKLTLSGSISVVTSGCYIKISKTITSDSPLAGQTISEIGLVLSDDKLFSRLITEPVTMNQNKSYTIDYYIYF